jgi:hypothetical protein
MTLLHRGEREVDAIVYFPFALFVFRLMYLRLHFIRSSNPASELVALDSFSSDLQRISMQSP